MGKCGRVVIQETIGPRHLAFFGCPRDRSVDSRPSRAAVEVTHSGLPCGQPRRTQRRIAANSASVLHPCTICNQSFGRCIGQGCIRRLLSTGRSASPLNKKGAATRTIIQDVENRSSRSMSCDSWHATNLTSPPELVNYGARHLCVPWRPPALSWYLFRLLFVAEGSKGVACEYEN